MAGVTSAFGVYRAPFGDAAYEFKLDVAGLRELQDKTDCGPSFLLTRIMAGQWRLDDLRETIRIGLVRGGLDAYRAMVLVERYFDDGPLNRHVMLAALILQAALYEPEEIEAPGKRTPGGKNRRTRKAASRSASSSAPPPRGDSHPTSPDG